MKSIFPVKYVCILPSYYDDDSILLHSLFFFFAIALYIRTFPNLNIFYEYTQAYQQFFLNDLPFDTLIFTKHISFSKCIQDCSVKITTWKTLACNRTILKPWNKLILWSTKLHINDKASLQASRIQSSVIYVLQHQNGQLIRLLGQCYQTSLLHLNWHTHITWLILFPGSDILPHIFKWTKWIRMKGS